MATAKKAAKKAAGKTGLCANIHAKQERIAHGSGEHMREPGSEGAPTGEAFRASAKTTKAATSAKRSAAAKKAARTRAARRSP